MQAGGEGLLRLDLWLRLHISAASQAGSQGARGWGFPRAGDLNPVRPSAQTPWVHGRQCCMLARQSRESYAVAHLECCTTMGWDAPLLKPPPWKCHRGLHSDLGLDTVLALSGDWGLSGIPLSDIRGAVRAVAGICSGGTGLDGVSFLDGAMYMTG